MPKKVLVLGAGASHAYGYPLGAELRQMLLSMSDHTGASAGIIHHDDVNDRRNGLHKFKGEFKQSQMYSIDAFLARRTEYAEIGKKCIAAILMSLEDKRKFFNEKNNSDHWYQYFLNSFTHQDWDDLDFTTTSIITFNYDRSLEHFLLYTLCSVYGKRSDEVLEKLKSLRILHIYGALGEILPYEASQYRPYESTNINSLSVGIAAQSINVIPEGRTDSVTLVKAREWMAEASAICFLGFGFDALNVDRLAEDDACSLWKQFPTGHTRRTIVGTCLGMTSAEITRAYGLLAKAPFKEDGSHGFHPTGCTQLLRETLFLLE